MRRTTYLYQSRGLLQFAVSDILSVDEEDPIEFLEPSVQAGRAPILDVHDVDPDLGAISGQADAELLSRDPLQGDGEQLLRFRRGHVRRRRRHCRR